jgi:coenzyme F420-0:L-glutamate ligase
MFSLQVIPIHSSKIIEKDDNLLTVLLDSMEEQELAFEDDDMLVVASKIVSVVENRIIDFDSITSTDLAKKLAKKAKISPEFAQIILNESNNNFIGAVPGAITTINQYGLLANAGADQSNVRDNQAIILPGDCKKSARKLHTQIKQNFSKYVGVIIADSRTMPLRLGTVGGALATYGFLPVIDERGNEDLFGRLMHITTRAIADQLATAAELVMGETNERIPFVIIRGYPLKRIKMEEEQDINRFISAEECMFLGPLMPCLEKL